MKHVTIVEIKVKGCGGCSCSYLGSQTAHYVINAERDSKRVRSVLKKDITEVLKEMTFEEDRDRLLPKVDQMVTALIEDDKTINLNRAASTTWKIVNDDEWTTYYPAR
jgi:hypothetical protein